MAFFVPNSNPWGEGLSTLAEAIAGAPANRARVRQMELMAANQEADNARADAQLRLQQDQAQRDIEKWAFEKDLKQAEERRAAQKFPLDLALTQGQIEQNSLANSFAAAENPLKLQEKQTAINLENARIGALPEMSGSMADAVMGNVERKMPAFDLGKVLKTGGSGLPPISSLPGMADTGMDYPAAVMDPAMGDIQHRMDLRRQIGSLADSAVLSDKNLNTAQWITDQTKAFGGGDSYRPITPEERQAYGIDPSAPVVMDANNKPTVLDNARPIGFRAATPEEKAQFGVKPDAPMMIDLKDGKPSILSDGKANVNVNTGGNAPETQIATEMGKRYDIARASSAALDALNNAQAALPGAITGAAANERLALQKVGAYLGVANPESITNTETFRAAMQPVVAAALHATVGSSQISDADREFAAKAAAGEITLDRSSIERLINIMRAANSKIVRQFNEDLANVYPDDGSGVPRRERSLFRVPEANAFYPSAIGPQQPKGVDVSAIPQQAIIRLKANHSPQAVADFDEIFGPGAATAVMGGH